MNEIQKSFNLALQERRQSARSLPESFNQALVLTKLSPPKDSKSQALVDIIKQTLLMVEDDGKTKALMGIEPAYHNRQHFADACLALAHFIEKAEVFSEHQKLLMMLTMLVHDYGHQGIKNLKPNCSQEEQTAKLLYSSPVNNLNSEDLRLVTELIMGTSPQNLKTINERYLNDKSNPRYLMQSLINDADIAASFIDSLTPSLTKAILIESGNLTPSEQEITAGITFFKKNFQITTDIAKSFLFTNHL